MSSEHTFSTARKELHGVLRESKFMSDGIGLFLLLLYCTKKSHRHWLSYSRQQRRRVRKQLKQPVINQPKGHEAE